MLNYHGGIDRNPRAVSFPPRSADVSLSDRSSVRSRQLRIFYSTTIYGRVKRLTKWMTTQSQSGHVLVESACLRPTVPADFTARRAMMNYDCGARAREHGRTDQSRFAGQIGTGCSVTTRSTTSETRRTNVRRHLRVGSARFLIKTR